MNGKILMAGEGVGRVAVGGGGLGEPVRPSGNRGMVIGRVWGASVRVP